MNANDGKINQIIVNVGYAIKDMKVGKDQGLTLAILNIYFHGAEDLIPLPSQQKPLIAKNNPGINNFSLKKSKTADIRKYLCPALSSVSDDAFEIAKVVTPLLFALQQSGIISISLNPILIASICVVIARTGIAVMCGDHKD